MAAAKRSQFQVRKDLLKIKRPSFTGEQERLGRMVERAGSPEAAAKGLFSRLGQLEAAVEAWEQRAAGAEGADVEPETAPAKPAEQA